MQRLERDIHQYFALRAYKEGDITPFLWTQVGGGPDKTLVMNGHPIQYREIQRWPTLIISAGRQPGKRPCFILDLDKKAKHAILQTLERGRDCFTDYHTVTKDLVRAAVLLAKQHGMQTLELSDASHIHCPERVSLANLSFITTGATWYERVIPLQPTKPRIIAAARSTVTQNTWQEVLHNMSPEIRAIFAELQAEGIDTTAPGSAMEVLNQAKKSATSCYLFSEYMDELLVASRLPNLDHSTWIHTIG